MKNRKYKLAEEQKVIIVLISSIALLSVLLALSFYTVNSNIKNKSTISKVKSKVLGQTTNASLSLTPSSGTVSVNNTTSLSVALNTDVARVYGTDVILNYDPTKFSVTNIVPITNTSFKTFAPNINVGVSWDDPSFDPDFDWQKAVDSQNGKIEFGAITFNFDPNNDGNYIDATTAPAYTGTTNLATITLQALPVRHNSTVDFDFSAEDGNTTDSNIVDTDLEDVLGADDVNGGQVTIIASELCRAAASDNNATVDLFDLIEVVNSYNTTCTYCNADPNLDGNVNLFDLTFIVDPNRWGHTCETSQ